MSNRRISQRALSAVQEKDAAKVPYRSEKDRPSMAVDMRPTTTQSQHGTDKKVPNEGGQTAGRQSAASLLPLPVSVAHRPSTALTAKVATQPSLVLSRSGFTPHKAGKLDPFGGYPSPAATGQLNFTQKSSGQHNFTQKSARPLDDITQIANRWNPVHLTNGKFNKNLPGSTPPSSHPRLLQLRSSQHKATVS